MQVHKIPTLSGWRNLLKQGIGITALHTTSHLGNAANF